MDDLERISELVSRIGGIGRVAPDADIYDAGFASLNALELLVELETAYDVTLGDDQFIAARTPAALRDLVLAAREEVAA